MDEQDKRFAKGLRPLSAPLGYVLAPVVKQYGFAHHALITEWEHIVGSTLALLTLPRKVVTKMRQEQQEGILHVDVYNSGIATELMYMETLLLDKIATYIGHRAITRIVYHHKPMMAQMRNRDIAEKEVVVSKAVKMLVEEVEDSALQKALLSLGKHLSTK